jgi:hypothetical protein
MFRRLFNSNFNANYLPTERKQKKSLKGSDDGALMMMQWRYSPDRALASLSGFMIVCISTMWGYHDRPILDTPMVRYNL